jgi:DNA-directed RNA polymerase specialized sigma24 family protein
MPTTNSRPAAATAAALWQQRQQINTRFIAEVERLRNEGYMTSEIARACGLPSRTLQQLLARSADRAHKPVPTHHHPTLPTHVQTP